MSSSISVGGDDAEEDLGNGAVALGSSDLELGSDPGLQLNGFGYRGNTSPQEFQEEEIKSNTGSAIFTIEDVDSPVDFTTNTNNLSNRTMTMASVLWTPTTWVVGSILSTLSTPDLSNLNPEIVNIPSWNGSDLVNSFDVNADIASRTGSAVNCPGGTSNVALMGTATQISTTNNGVASRAIDGNTNGNFGGGSVTHTANQLETWWELDLGSSYDIEDIVVWNRTDNCCSHRLSDFYVLVSDVPFTSTDLTTTLNQTGVWSEFHPGEQATSHTYSPAVIGRYVRIQHNSSEVLSLAEVQVMGCDPPILNCDLDPGLISETTVVCPGSDPSPISNLESPSQCNLVENPHLEEGIGVDWIHNSSNGAAAVFLDDNTSQLSGVNSIYVNQTVATGPFWHTETRPVSFSVTAGESYTLSFEARATVARDIQVSLQLREAPWTQWNAQTIALTPTGTTFTVTITPNISSTNVSAMFKSANETGEFWIDNISVVHTSCVEPSFEYQWQYSEDGGTTWIDLAGQTADSYDPGVISADRLYRRNVRVAGCTPYEASNEVLAEYCACTIDAGVDQTICEGESVTLNTTATGAVNYNWTPTIGLSDPTAANPSASPSATTTYTLTIDDGSGCTASDQVTVTVDPNPVVTLTLAIDEVCEDIATVVLNGGLPTGGTYTGPNVSGTTFDAAAAGIGTHTVTYTYINPATGCEDFATDVITINEIVTPTFIIGDTDFCVDEVMYTLTEGSPVGGVYTLNGVTITDFDPSAAGVGTHTLTYTYTTTNGCVDIATEDVTVYDLPVVTFTPTISEVCESDPIFNLDGFAPAGGTFSGTVVNGNQLDPSQLIAQSNTIIYTCLLYTSPSPRDATLSRMPSSA